MPRAVFAMIRPVNFICLAFIFILLFATRPALAQPSREGLSHPGSGLVGGGIFGDVSGDLQRLGSLDSTVGPLGFLYGTVFVTSRIAIGAEFSTLGTEDHSGTINSYGDLRTQFHDSAVYGVARVRIVRRRIVSVDAVGGIGEQFNHQEYHFFPTSGTASDYTRNTHYLSYVTGADMPIEVVPHVVVSPFARFYFLRGMAKYPDDSPSWQTGIGLGATAAFTW